MPPTPDGSTPADSGWKDDPRWQGISRPYSPEDVARLSGSVQIQHTLAQRGARRLWEQLNSEKHVAALGAVTGNQAMQMIRAGLSAIYCSGWQVAADGNLAGQTYPLGDARRAHEDLRARATTGKTILTP